MEEQLGRKWDCWQPKRLLHPRQDSVPPQTYSAVEFDALAEKYASLNWRLVSKPGGATVKPDDFYVLYGRAPCFNFA